MNELQKSLISFGAIIIIGILIYFGSIWYLKSYKKMKDNKMLTMNLVIKYKLFLEYLSYQDKNKQNYYLFLIKINNLGVLENTYSDYVVKNYLTKTVKELSIYLPFGGKIAQTTQRDTFIIYYPTIDDDAYLLGKQLKLFAQKSYHENGIHITKTNSIAVIDKHDLTGLSNALVSSVRNLGEPTIYDAQKHHLSEEFMSLNEKLKTLDYKLRSFNVETIKVKKVKEVYNDLFINGIELNDFLNQLPVADQSWMNMYLLEYILNKIYYKNIYANISLPVLLVTIENQLFVDYLETIVKANQFLLENIIVSIKLTSVSNEDQLIKNILTLSNLGIKMSLNLDDINQNIYNAIQRYHIKRLEINDILMNHSLIAELLYFSKVNHIEVLYKTEQKNIDEQSLNVTHMTKDMIKFNEDKQKRGRR